MQLLSLVNQDIYIAKGYILNVSTVILRDSWYPMDDPDELFSIFAYFIREARKIKNCYVILSTILPSVENQTNCDVHFHEFDEGQKISEYFFLFLQKQDRRYSDPKACNG